jgi:hypothetical protein
LVHFTVPKPLQVIFLKSSFSARRSHAQDGQLYSDRAQMSGMLVNRLPLRCRPCGHDWVQETKLPTGMKQFVDMMQQLRCLDCHASMVALHVEFGMTVLASPTKGASPK